MNLGDIRTRLQDLYGNTLTSESSFYNRIINDAYKKICSLQDWWWLENDYPFTLKGIVASVTSTATINTATVVTSSALTSADYTGGWCYSGNHTYRINSIVTTTVTLDQNWIEATGTAYACTYWNDIVPCPSATDFVLSVIPRNDPNHLPLRQVPIETIEAHGPDVSDDAQEVAEAFAVFKEDSSSTAQALLKIRMWPPADEKSAYVMRYRVVPADLSADGDIPLIPEKHHTVLCDMAKLELMKIEREDPDVIQSFEMEAAKGLQRLTLDQYQRGNVLHRFGRREQAPIIRALSFKTVNTSSGSV